MPSTYSPNSPLALRFCEEYVVDLNGAAAARRAGYSEKRARIAASELLGMRAVQDRIGVLQAERSERTAITADHVLELLWARATADPRELVEYRRTCCRHCWGKEFSYQRTAREISIAQQQWDTRATKKPDDSFDAMGGTGFDARQDPNPKCPECFGEGRAEMFVNDTRHLSRAGQRLYAGVKRTKDGLEVKMHDQDAALLNVGRHLGMFKDVVEHRDLTLEDLIRDAAGVESRAGNS